MIVNNCNNCPFRYTDFDPNAMGYDSADMCTLAIHNRLGDNIIRTYDWYDVQGNDHSNDITPVPDWCPLKEGFITMELKQ